VSSVERHLRILEERAPEMLDLYRLVGRDVLRLATEKSTLEAGTVARLETLFQSRRSAGAPLAAEPATAGKSADADKGARKKR